MNIVSEVDPKDLTMRPPFSDLFLAQPSLVERLVEDMKVNGYDKSKPVTLWMTGDALIVVDGNTRLTAALQAGLTEIFACVHDFKNETHALQYALQTQRNRRNVKDPELMRAMLVVEKHAKANGMKVSREAVAAAVGVVPRNTKFNKLRSLAIHAEATGDTTFVDSIANGEMSVNVASQRLTQHKREQGLPSYMAGSAEQIAARKPATPRAFNLDGALARLGRWLAKEYAAVPTEHQDVWLAALDNARESLKYD